MIAFKFLGAGRYSLLAGFTWPLGDWVEVEGPVEPTINGVHGCRIQDLPYWLDEALWRIELDGDAIEGERGVVAARGRLLDRVAEWNPTAWQEFAETCEARNRGLGSADPRDGWIPYAGAAYIAAHGAGLEAALAGGSYEEAAAAERAWQAGWLADRLGLS
jgi:hypothetical protein